MKIKNRMICVILTLVIMSGVVFSAIYAKAENNYFDSYDRETINPYVYENSMVSIKLNILLERTENLKETYSLSAVLEVLKDLKEVVKEITSIDYETNYEILHDEANYETGEFRKYKMGIPEWIIRNILSLICTYSPEEEETMKQVIDYIYEMGGIEMQNHCKEYSIMNIINDLNFCKENFPLSFQEYLEYVLSISSQDCMEYDKGNLPEIKIPSAYKEEYDQKKKEENPFVLEENQEGTLQEESEVILIPDISEEDISLPPVVLENLPSNEIYEKDNLQDYLSQIENISQSAEEVKTYEIKSIYYTLDKTKEHPEWQDTRILLSEEGDIPFEKLKNIFQLLEKKESEFFFVEDSDMVMFIAEGKPLVLNKVEKVTADEIDIILEGFEKIGMKVMLKSDEKVDTFDSLASRVEAGKINQILVNENKIILNAMPILTKNILQLPIKQVAEALGYQTFQKGNTITLIYQGAASTEESNLEEITIVLTVGETTYTINGKKNSFKVPVTEKDNILYVEFDQLANKLGYSYEYNKESGFIEFQK